LNTGASASPDRVRLARTVAVVLLVVWTVVIWQLLTSPRVGTRAWYPWMPYVRNFAHAVLFGVQALLIGWSLRPGPVGRPLALWLAASGLALAYGGLTEWRQAVLPERTASWIDVGTDAIGAFGLPWALSTGRVFSGRLALVLVAAAAASIWATLT
jgi:VanZ family protein